MVEMNEDERRRQREERRGVVGSRLTTNPSLRDIDEAGSEMAPEETEEDQLSPLRPSQWKRHKRRG
jgi:hypothetical protein